MSKFRPQLYIRLIEQTDNESLKNYMEEEIDMINSISQLEEKIIVDLGAGYGRAWPHFQDTYKKLIGIEINPKMFSALEINARSFEKNSAIKGDVTKLNSINKILNKDKVVFLLLQNTLGVIEGNWEQVLNQIKSYSATQSKELILSTFRAQALKDTGKSIYRSLQEMLGEPNLNQSDLENGIIKTTSGYEAKWWKDEELKLIIDKLDAEIIRKQSSNLYKIFHLKL